LILFIVSANYLFAQETTSKNKFGIYIKAGVEHDYPFKLNSTLSMMGYKNIPDILTSGVFGIYYDIKKIELAYEAGISGAYAKTRLLNVCANLSVGYILTLPKEHRLIFSGNIAYVGYSVFAHSEKGNLDFDNLENPLTNSTMFHLELQQFMAGTKVTWRNQICDVSIGYDFGCVPARWKSNNVNITNSPKERIDKVHLDLAVYFLRR
ncbi:MAG: hypothetical protein LBL13_01540, partial [Bacteroidales bacterium]|jgi:hypothetical protein|nr:hypothetical protein [Bacteroidales bacterium]